MLLTSWVRNFAQTIKSRRRAARREQNSWQTQAWNGRATAARQLEVLEDKSLLTALVIDQNFADANPGVINITNATIDQNSDSVPEFDEIIINNVMLDGNLARGININLSDLNINRIGIQELDITGSSLGAGVNITLDNVELESLVIDRSNITSSNGGGIDINLNDVSLPELTVYQTTVAGGLNEGLTIDLTSTTRDSNIDELDISESTIDGVTLTAAGIKKNVIDAQTSNPVQLTVVDYNLQPGATVEVDGIVGIDGANTQTTISPVLTVNPITGLLEPDENLLTLDGVDGTGGFYQGGGELTVFTTINSARISDNVITGTTGNDGLQVSFTNTRTTDVIIQDNPTIRSLVFDLNNSPIDELTIRNNADVQADRAQVDGMRFNLNESTLTNLVLDNNVVTGNGISGAGGIVFDATDSNVLGMITNNTVTNTIGNGIEFTATASNAFVQANRGPLVFDFALKTTTTQLAADIDASTTTIEVIDGLQYQAQQYLLIDNEQVFVQSVLGNTLTVVRGQRGTLPAPHTAGTDVKSVTTAAEGVKNGIVGNTVSTNDGAGIFAFMAENTSLIADIESNTITANETRGIDLTVQDTSPVPGKVARGGISRTATTLNVVDASVFSNRLLPFNVMLESEEMTVTAIDGNVLTVERGVNGTAPRFHNTNTDVIPVDGDGLVLNIGGETAAQGNVLDQNIGGGVHLELQDSATGQYNIKNNIITRTVDSANANDGDAIEIELTNVDEDVEASNVLRRTTIDSNLLGVDQVTTLSLPISGVLGVFQVDDASIFNVGDRVQLDGEQVDITAITGNTISVNRGVAGTFAVDHEAGATIFPVTGGNAGRGIDFTFVELSVLEDIIITNNTVVNNDDDGIRFFRTDDGITRTVDPLEDGARAVTIRSNTISRNALAAIADVQVAAGSFITYAAGIEVQTLNGTGDEFDITIDQNKIFSTGIGGAAGSINGINLRAEADARVLAAITNNEVRFNQDDGLSMTERANAQSDLRDISANLFGNDISDNFDDGIDISVRSGENQVMVIGQEGTDNLGRSLRNTINRNFDSGIEVTSANNFLAIINNDLDDNGFDRSNNPPTSNSSPYGTPTGETALTGSGIRMIGAGSQVAIKANSIDNNAGAGIDIQNGGNFSIRNNSITFNENDGIEFDGLVQATILNNFVASNQGRGIDIVVEPDAGQGSEVNYKIGDGLETGRNRLIGNNLEGLYYVITADPAQDQNIDSAAANALSITGTTTSEVNAIINIDTNTVTDNGVGTASPATGIIFRVGSQGAQVGGSTLATTAGSGNEGINYDDARAADPTIPGVIGSITDANGYGTVGSEDENPNGRTNARIVNNFFDGNFGDDVRFEPFVSTVDPVSTIGTWNALAFTILRYETDPLSRLNLIFEGNKGNGLQSFGIPDPSTDNTASYYNDEEVFKRRDAASNANLTSVADGDGVPAVGPWPIPVTTSRPVTDVEAQRVIYRTPSRTHFDNPLNIFGDPTAIQEPFDPPRSAQNPLPDGANIHPDAQFQVVDVQFVDAGNGISEIQVTVAPSAAYPMGLPFPENVIHDEDRGLFPVVEVSGVRAIGGGLHSANGVWQVFDVDPIAGTFKLRGSGGEAGPGYLSGGQVVYNQNPPSNNPAMLLDPPHGFPFDQAYLYSGAGEPTFRVAQGFDDVGLSASNEFERGTNFFDTFSHPRAGLIGDQDIYHFIPSNAPLVSQPWGIWSENVTRSGGINNVQPDPSDPVNRTLITAPNHQLTNFRRVEISDVVGVPTINATALVRVIDVDTFSVPIPFVGVYGGGGAWETVDDSFPEPFAPTFPLSDVQDITPDPRTSDTGVVTLNFTEQVDNVDIDDLFLTRDGIPVDISSIAVTQVSGSTYNVDLSSVSGDEGLYELLVDVELPTADIVDISPDPSLDPIGEVVINFTEDVTGVDIFDFTLYRDINDGLGAQPVDLSEIGANLEVEQITRSQYVVNLSSVTVDEGLYRLSLLAPRTFTTIDSVTPNAQNEAVFNVVNHGLSTGQVLNIEGIIGVNVGLATQLNGEFRIIVDDSDHFRLADNILQNVVMVDDVNYNLAQATLTFDPNIIDRVGRRFSVESVINGLTQPADASDVFVIAAQSPTGEIQDIDPDPRNSPVNSVRFSFSEPVVVSSVNVSDFTLTRNIGFGPFPVSLAAASVVPIDADVFGFATQFDLTNLGGATSAAGDYRLTLTTTDSTRIQDRQGAFLVFPDFDDWTKTDVGPAPLIQPIFPDPTTTPVGLVRFTFNEPVSNVDELNANTHFTLTRDTGDGNGPQPVLLLDSSNQPLPITRNSATDFELDLTPVTGDGMGNSIDGTYRLTLNRSTGITADSDGEELAVDATDSWLQDATAPTADILDIDPDPRIRDAGLVFIQFDEPVTGVNRFDASTDFTLQRDIGDGNGFQNITLVGQRVRPLDPVDANGNRVLPFDPTTVFATQYVLDLSPTNLTDIDGTYILSLNADGSIVDATGNQFNSPTNDTWILVPKGPISGIDDIIFTGNAVSVDSVDRWFNDTTAPFVVPGTVTIDPDPRSTSVGFVEINFSEDVTGFNISDLVLSRTDTNGTQEITLDDLTLNQITPRKYSIDLNLVTGGQGTYSLFVDGTNSLIQDLAGNPLQSGLITLDTWVVENIGPSASLSVVPNPRTTPASDVQLTFTKPVDASQVDLSDFRLELDTGNGFTVVTLGSGSVVAVNPTGGFADTYTIDLSAQTNVEGTYRVTLVAADSGIVDQAGIELAADASTTWNLDNTAPLADIIDVFPDPRLTEVDIVNILFNEGVAGVDISDFSLTLNGGNVDISAAPFVQETARRYTIDLTNFTAADGTYELQLSSTGGITDLGGNPLQTDGSLGIANVAALDEWFKGVDNVAPMVAIEAITSPRSTPAGIVGINFSEDVTGVDINDFTLTLDGAPQDLSQATVTNLPGSISQYSIDLTDTTSAQGTYVLSVVTTDTGSPIVDASGNPLASGASATWINQQIDPFASIEPITPNPRLRPVGVVTVNFTTNVTGVDIGDFSLTRDPGTGVQPVSLRGIEVIQSPLGANQYLIDLTKVTGADGQYRLTLNSQGSGIVTEGTTDPLLADAVATWETITAISVNTFTDSVDVNPGDGIVADANNQVSLRAAVMEAGSLPGDDTIFLGSGTYSLSLGGDDEEFGATGDLDIFDTSGSLRIVGQGADLTTIDAAGLERVFHITNGGNLILEGVTITGGQVEGSQDGGGIRNDAGIVEIRDSVITGNASADDGGGINNAGVMTIINSTISDNSAVNNGGAIRNVGMLTLQSSLIGGIDDVDAMIDNRNVAGLNGGGIFNVSGATVNMVNTTISGNIATQGSGGGFLNLGTADLQNVTIARNEAGQRGGGISAASGNISMQNTLILSNSAINMGPDVSSPSAGSITTLGNNLVGINDDAATIFPAGLPNFNNDFVGTAGAPILVSDIVETDANGVPVLADNGGPTLTHALVLATTGPRNFAIDGGTAPTGGSNFLSDAVDSGAGTDSGATSVQLTNGTGDGFVDIPSINNTGEFRDADYDPVGIDTSQDVVFDSSVYFRSNGTGTRSTLGTLATGASTIRNTATEANSSFTVGNLTFTLTQTVTETFSVTGAQNGSLLTQTYRITNTGGAAENFELVRYVDGDIGFDGTPVIDGGGRLIAPTGDEILFETDSAGSPSSATSFFGITGKNGIIPATGRFELDAFLTLEPSIQAGNALDDTITNDVDGDQFVDTAFDVTLALQNNFALAPGETGVYTTHTIFGSGPPSAVGEIAPITSTTNLVNDQRGINRILGNGVVDIGAYEFGGFFTNSSVDSVDVNPGDGFVADNFGRRTLRAAIMETNALAQTGISTNNAIQLDSATYDYTLTELDTTQPTVDIVNVLPDPLASQTIGSDQLDVIEFQFSEPVINVDITDITLTFDSGAGPSNLSLAGAVLEQDPSDITLYRVTGLESLLANDGLYRFDVNISDITDFEGNALAEDPQLNGTGVGDRDEFTRGADIFAPTVTLSSVGTPRTTNPGIIDINFSEDVFGLSLSSGAPNFSLTFNGTPVSLNQTAVQQISFSQYQLDLSPVTEQNGLTDIGSYVLTLDASLLSIQDFSGNLLTGTTTVNWTVIDDNVAPMATIEPVTPNPRIGFVSDVTVTFDEPVMGVNLNNAEVDFDLIFDPDGPGITPAIQLDLSGIMVNQVSDSEYTLDLNSVTRQDGFYTLTLVAADGMITDFGANLAMTANPLVADASTMFEIGEDTTEFGDIDIQNGRLTLLGTGAGQSIIDANSLDRAFDVFPGVEFIIDDLSITGGNAADARDGGGLRNEGTVTIQNVDFSNNAAGGKGGAIYNDGTVDVVESSFIANTGDFGGGIFSNSGNVTLTEATISNNTALTDGGGFYNDRSSTVSISGSIVTGNSASQDGAGIYNNDTATATITDSTISNNVAGADGGGVYSEQAATASLTNTNIAFNKAANGGGVFNQDGTISVSLSTFSANEATQDGGGFFVTTAGILNAADSSISSNSAGGAGGGFFNSGTVTLDNIQILDNTAANGGGIGNTLNLSTTSTTISGNTASVNGGGISNSVVGSMTLASTTITNNTADNEGGGIYNDGAAGFTVNSSTIANNTASVAGGAISQRGTGSVSVQTSTLSGNTATNGGGINSTQALNIQDATISGNTAIASGGAIFNNGGAITLQSATVFDNTAGTSAGGISNNSVFGPINLKNTIVARNNAPTDVDVSGVQFVAQGVVNPGSVALGFNLIGDRGSVTTLIDGIAGNLVGTTGNEVDPLLGPLEDNGGPSLTHAVLFGSPARDTGSNFGVNTTDQRGFARLFDGDGNGTATVDVGAFESGFTVNTFADSIDVNEGDRSSADANGNSSLRAAIMEANALPGDDTILLIPGTFRLTIAGRDDDTARFGDLDVKDSLTIIGSGTDQTFIDAASLDRVFHVLPGGTLNLKNLTIIRGEEVNGGGVLNQGFLTLENVLVQNNNADFGGGVFNDLITDTIGGTTLAQTIVAGATSFNIADASGLPAQTPFVIEIDSEQMQVTGINGNNLTVTRGFNGTTPAGHAVGAAINLILDPTATVMSVTDPSVFPTDVPFDIRIGAEEIRVISINGNTFNLTRGVNGTTAADHTSGDEITLVQSLDIIDSTLTGNESRLQGGGLFNRNISTTVTRSNISGNNSNDQGGGIFNRGRLVIADATFDSNLAAGTGGAIYNDGFGTTTSRITMTGSTLSNNLAGAQGGGIYNNDLFFVTNSTISGNHANAIGGAIFNTQQSDGSSEPGAVALTNVTITNNTSDNIGAGVVNDAFNPLNRVDVLNSIVAGNDALMGQNDVIGTFNSLGANLIGESDGTHGFTNSVNLDLVGTDVSPFDPVIGDLADNGGPTLTHALLPGSPAIDNGNNSGGDPVDQRGGRRPTDTTADIGAFEVQLNRLSIGNVTMAEGDTGSTIFTFTVILESPTAEPISVGFQTVQDTAKAGSDFLPQSGTLNFAPGDVTQQIDVEVNGDISIEPNEQFFVLLSNPVNTDIVTTQAVGTIQNDDTSVSIADVDIREGDAGANSTLTFTVNLSQPTVETVTVTLQTSDGSAVAGADYDTASGSVTFAPGEQSKTFDVNVLGDNTLEPNETFTLDIVSAVDSANNNILQINSSATGTINNDEVSASISFSDPEMNSVLDLNEGNSGSTAFDFTVNLDQPVDATVTIDVATIDSTAIGGSDFVARNETLTFTAGETSKLFSVSVNGDTAFETDEDFFVRLSNATRDMVADPNAVLGLDATGRILNDEPLPDEYLIILNSGTNMVEVYLNDPMMTGAPIQTSDLATQLVVNGDNGGATMDDIFIIDYSNGDPIPTVAGMPGLVVNGLTQSAGDSLVIQNGSVTDVIYTSENSNDGTIQFDSKLVEYNGLEPITDNLNAVNRTFDIHAGDHQIRLADDTAIAGNSIVDSNQTNAFESVSFANPSSSLTINAGSGNNTITMSPIDAAFSGSASISINGDAGNDTIDGSAFDRSFSANGGAGMDVITGGSADDNLSGGLDSDTISGGGGADTIRGNDSLNADDGAADQLNGDAGADNIDGEGGDDFIDGGTENDILAGGDGADNVSGGDGDDNISGGLGNDVLNGNAGDDVINGDAGMDMIDGGTGNDNLSGGDDNDTIDGGADNDVIDGQAGDDVVGGGTGNDNVQGGDGSDTLSGGGGMDTLDGGAGVGTDQVSETATGDSDITLTDSTIIVNGITTTHTNIDEFILIGGDQSNVIDASAYSGAINATGGDGNDTIIAGNGNDTISGDAGNDVITANGGNDIVMGGGGMDDIDGGTGDDILSGNSQNDTVRGGVGNDLVSGNAGADVLAGEDGDDTLRGDEGDDVLDGGADQDVLLGGDGIDNASGGTGDDIILGEAGNDVLLGGDGGDVMVGDSGDDFMDGEEGPDTALGSAGKDTMVGGNGTDFLDGQGTLGDVILLDATAAADIINVTQVGVFTQVSLTGGTPFTVNSRRSEQIRINTLDGDDVVTFGDLTGASQARFIIDLGAGADTVDGDANPNPNVAISADGGAGADLLIAGPGADDLDGGADNDVIDGQAGLDTVAGGEGDDVVIGGLDNDTIDGNQGNDVLIGGSGTDVINGGDGADFVRGNGGKDTIAGGDGNDTLYGDQSGDFIQGDAGNDQIAGRAGNDVLFGGDGADLIRGDDGDDFIIGGRGDDLISGGRNNDSVIGDLGADVIFGDDDNDVLFGSGGADLIVGGDDVDIIKGQGSGQDILLFGNGSGDPGNVGQDTVPSANDVDEINNAFVVDQLLIDLLNF